MTFSTKSPLPSKRSKLWEASVALFFVGIDEQALATLKSNEIHRCGALLLRAQYSERGSNKDALEILDIL